MKITVLSGGVGGARFTRGLLALVGSAHEITVIANTGDDMWLHGVRVCPDLDTLMYTLGGAVHEDQGWGRRGESRRVSDELAGYDLGWEWFTLGDLDLATHLARTELLRRRLPLSAVTAQLATRWQPGVTLLPMTDDEVETQVVLEDGREIHFEEWWVRHRAAIPARRFVQTNLATSTPAPGVLDALTTADVVVIPPSNPVVSVGTILAIPGIRDALTSTDAPVVGVSPVVGGSPVRGMADACLTAIGVETTALAVAEHYGRRADGGILDAWLVDEVDADAAAILSSRGWTSRAVPALMTDVSTAARLAARRVSPRRPPRLRAPARSAVRPRARPPRRGRPARRRRGAGSTRPGCRAARAPRPRARRPSRRPKRGTSPVSPVSSVVPVPSASATKARGCSAARPSASRSSSGRSAGRSPSRTATGPSAADTPARTAAFNPPPGSSTTNGTAARISSSAVTTRTRDDPRRRGGRGDRVERHRPRQSGSRGRLQRTRQPRLALGGGLHGHDDHPVHARPPFALRRPPREDAAMTLWLTGDPTADQLLTDDPFALLIGMLLDQQVTMESAFAGPAKIAARMDGLDVHRIAEADPDRVRGPVRDTARGPPLPRLDGRTHPGRRGRARRALRRRRHAPVDRR